jgi:hypothetical protein
MLAREVAEKIKRSSWKYYVYLLRDPKGHVFYVGKGSGRRLLQHEREIFNTHYRVHTNWKKLNRIAQIIASAKSIDYQIDSWHKEEDSAFRREDELAYDYEVLDPRSLCNSNGARWRGYPGKALIKLRAERGLATRGGRTGG